MNAGHELRVTRGFSASSEARQMMADWLRTTQLPIDRMYDARAQAQGEDLRETLAKRYPCGLVTDAEIEALVSVLQR